MGDRHCFDPELVALMRKPDVGRALIHYERFRRQAGLPYPTDASPEVTALACVHKSRLMWRGSSKAMVRESKAWLVEHGMASDVGSAPHLRVQ